MKQSNEIRFDFQNALSQARRLEALAETIERQGAAKLNETSGGVNTAWKGESAHIYLGKLEELARQVRETARMLRDIAADIRRIAKTVYDAEMQALEIARKRMGASGPS